MSNDREVLSGFFDQQGEEEKLQNSMNDASSQEKLKVSVSGKYLMHVDTFHYVKDNELKVFPCMQKSSQKGALQLVIPFRVVDGTTKNLFNARENGEFAREGAGDVTYPTRSGGGGAYGMRGRVTFNGQDKRGAVIRLFSDTSDEFKGVVRDALQTLSSFRIKIQGQVAIE